MIESPNVRKHVNLKASVEQLTRSWMSWARNLGVRTSPVSRHSHHCRLHYWLLAVLQYCLVQRDFTKYSIFIFVIRTAFAMLPSAYIQSLCDVFCVTIFEIIYSLSLNLIEHYARKDWFQLCRYFFIATNVELNTSFYWMQIKNHETNRKRVDAHSYKKSSSPS